MNTEPAALTTRQYTARLGRKTLKVTVSADRQVSACDSKGEIYVADGVAASDGNADVIMFYHGIKAVGRLIVDQCFDRAYFA